MPETAPPSRRRTLAISHLLGALVTLALASACAEPPTILIGLAGPFKDPAGATMVQAAQLAIAEINAAGGVRGRRLELMALDDHGDPDSAVAVAGVLRATAAVAVIGHVWSSTTLAAGPVYGGGTNPVPVITPSSSAPELTALGPYLFRACPTDVEHGRALAEWARTGLQVDRAAVLYVNDGYGRGIQSAFAATFARRGGTVVGAFPYLDPDADIAPYLDLIRREGLAQALVIAGSREDARLILALVRARGLSLPILGGDGLEGLEEDGAIGEGVYISNAWLPEADRPHVQSFLDQWRQQFPDQAPPNQPAAATYDVVHLLATVIQEAGADRKRIRSVLAEVGRSLPAYEGVTGRIQFTEQGDLAARVVGIAVVRGGHLVRVEGR